ncbi:hypothetical protein HPB50_018835 [Hyalomma asiaticum]|uniref:Uncharacterized protein n=1 Tax=Hyalomma asiaticum TaxID=266040 RepID=A0ACB7RRP6_HYAAI|nr:hypothetical protein HPB50_018835 [Hyalomma asiaticum]
MELREGILDEFLQWPFCHNVKLTFMHPTPDKQIEIYNMNPSHVESLARPTPLRSEMRHFICHVFLEDLESGGYVDNDRLHVKWELQPPLVHSVP